MSAIAGIVGSSRSAGVRLADMLQAQHARGPDADSQLVVDAAAFGHAAHITTSQARRELQPLTHAMSGCVITADIRLDNRKELIAKLSPARSDSTGDAELALLAYLRWGPAFGRELLGDFAIALWDPREALVLLCRDHFGVRPVTYASTADELVFASTVRAVLAGSQAPHPLNIEKLHHYLVEPLEAASPADTTMHGVYRLPAAHYLTWRPGTAVRVERYWRLEPATDLRLATDAEYQEAFRDVLDASVRCRLQPNAPTATLFSGGLDSSAVLAAALTSGTARHLLPVYAAVEEDATRAGSDAPHIEAVLRHFDHAEHATRFSIAAAAEAYDLQEILRDPDALFESNMTFLWSIVQAANANGHRVLLTGLGGDELLYLSAPHQSWELMRKGQLMRSGREMIRKEGAWSWPTRHLRHAVGQLLPERARRGVRALQDHRSAPADPLADYAFEPEIAARLLAQRRDLGDDPEWNTANSRVNNMRKPFVPVGLERYDRVGARHGVELRHPMLDKRFVEFCVSLPSDQLVRNGWEKHILRAASQSLPRSVAWRPKSLVAQGVYWHAIRARYRDPHRVLGAQALAGVFGPISGNDPDDENAVIWQRAVVHEWHKLHVGNTQLSA